MTPESLVVMPYIDHEAATRCAALMVSRAGTSSAGIILGIQDTDRAGFISLINRTFKASKSKFFGYVAQDAFPGRQWLSLALNVMRLPDKGLFAFNDGKWMGILASFGLASREWAEKNYGGNFFFPGYVSHYADAELSVLAMSERKYSYDANSLLVEVDWNKDSKVINATDRALYKTRSNRGFDGRVISSNLLGLFS